MASHTSLDIHSNEAWNYYRVHTKVELMSSIQKKMLGIRYDMVEVKNKFTNYICMQFCIHEVKRSVHFGLGSS